MRLARRVKSIQRLPFIVGTNPYIKRVYKLYYDSFQAITACEEKIRGKEDLDRFAAVLQGLVESHADVIPMLSQGINIPKEFEMEMFLFFFSGEIWILLEISGGY